MSISAAGSAVPQYQVPMTPQAKVQDEQTESVAVRNKEAETVKDAAVPVSTNKVDVKA